MVRNSNFKKKTSIQPFSLSKKRRLLNQRHFKKLERNSRILKGEQTPKNTKKLLIKTKAFKQKEKRKRIKNLERDSQHFSLKKLSKTSERIQFQIVDERTAKINKINFKVNGHVNCTCFDWRIKCKKYEISCKHILFVLSRILKINLNSVKKNILKFKTVFQHSFDKFLVHYLEQKQKDFRVFDSGKTEGICVICLSPLDLKKKILNCPKCLNLVHEDCMTRWLQKSRGKKCVFCRDSVWRRFHEGLLENFK